MQLYLLKFIILRWVENDNKIIFLIMVSNSFVNNTISLVLSITPSWYGMEAKIVKLYNGQEGNSNEKISLQKSIKREENTNESVQWLKKIWKWLPGRKRQGYIRRKEERFFFFCIIFKIQLSKETSWHFVRQQVTRETYIMVSQRGLFRYSSENHRVIEVGKHLWRLSIPSPLLRSGSAKVGFSGLCPVGF